MKTKLMIIVVGFVLMGANLYAADGDLIVNGNVGVGTNSPTQKLDVNGNVKGTGLCIGNNCTSTLHVSGGLYGSCITSGGYCSGALLSPALCQSTCACPAGYTRVQTGSYYAYGGEGGDTNIQWYSCYKN